MRATLSTKLKQALDGKTLTWFAFNGFWNYFGVYSIDNRSKALAIGMSATRTVHQVLIMRQNGHHS
jgi:hypothetical protein